MKILIVATTIAVATVSAPAFAQMRGGHFDQGYYGFRDPGVLYRFANGRRQLALEPPPPPGSGLCNTVQIAAGNCVYYRR